MFPLRVSVGIKADKPRPIERGLVCLEDDARKQALEKFRRDSEKMLKNVFKN